VWNRPSLGTRLAALLAAFLAVSCQSKTGRSYSVENADIILVHGHVFTANSAQLWSEGIAVHGDRVLAVGSNQAVLKYQIGPTRVINMRGLTATPGLIYFAQHAVADSTLERRGITSIVTAQEMGRSSVRVFRTDAHQTDTHPELLPKPFATVEQTLRTSGTLEAALAANTSDAAQRATLKDVGTLQPGSFADLAVLSTDLQKSPPDQIQDTQVLLTMIGGKIVWNHGLN
jgi:imidazolonepropionase-like amidohydrolase